MCNVIMIGCDLHDATMVLRVSCGTEPSVRKTFPTSDRAGLIAWLRESAAARNATRIVFAYEASGQGFGLYDDLTGAGIECAVLAPTSLPHTVRSRKTKNDDRDAELILDHVRSHLLAGTELHSVWVPSPETRDDREAVRLRLETAEDRTRIKNQIKNLAKRWQLALPSWFTASGDWSKRSLAWLVAVGSGETGGLGEGARTALSSLVALYQSLTIEIQRLDKAIQVLSRTPRYTRMFRKLTLLPGVGTLTAMVFLTELGDLERFANRRDLAAYLGLVPATYESGERNDRKGHITRQGPARVRHVLCQAAWAALRCSAEWRMRFDRIKRGSKTRSKIAIVAVMRQLAVTMWHTARSRELDQKLDEFDSGTTSARAQRKGGRPSHVAVASSQSG
jgi:transposase